jgi:YesN/AraC family two-component response regulator
MPDLGLANSPAKILVADDEKSLYHLLSKYFCEQIRNRKYEFTYVQNGQQALNKIQTEHYDLALIDIKMPVLDGLSLLKQLNQQQINIKTIIFSAYSTIEYLMSAIKERVCDYVVKPNFEELEESIEKTLAIDARTNAIQEEEISQTTDDSQQKNPFFSSVFSLAEELTPSQQYRLVYRLIANFKPEQFEDLQESLPTLASMAQKRQEMQEETLLQLLAKEKSRIEPRVETRELKRTQELKHYQYYYLRWPIPGQRDWGTRKITQKELKDPQIRKMVEEKLGKSIEINS